MSGLHSFCIFGRTIPFSWMFLSSVQGPCHTELHASLDVIAQSQQTLGEKFTSFYLPNCDKHGFYKAKQVAFPVCPNQWTLTLKRHTNPKILVFFLSLSVRDFSRRPASSLLVCVVLERKENPRNGWFIGGLPVSSGAHAVKTYIYFHTRSTPIYSYVYGLNIYERVPPDTIIDHKTVFFQTPSLKAQDPNLGLHYNSL